MEPSTNLWRVRPTKRKTTSIIVRFRAAFTTQKAAGRRLHDAQPPARAIFSLSSDRGGGEIWMSGMVCGWMFGSPDQTSRPAPVPATITRPAALGLSEPARAWTVQASWARWPTSCERSLPSPATQLCASPRARGSGCRCAPPAMRTCAATPPAAAAALRTRPSPAHPYQALSPLDWSHEHQRFVWRQ